MIWVVFWVRVANVENFSKCLGESWIEYEEKILSCFGAIFEQLIARVDSRRMKAWKRVKLKIENFFLNRLFNKGKDKVKGKDIFIILRCALNIYRIGFWDLIGLWREINWFCQSLDWIKAFLLEERMLFLDLSQTEQVLSNWI